MDEHITPLVWSTLAQYGMLSASFAAAGDTLKAWGISVSLKRRLALDLQVRTHRLIPKTAGCKPTARGEFTYYICAEKPARGYFC